MTDASVDTIFAGPAKAQREAGISSDAAWTWVRRAHSGELVAFAVIGGTYLVVDDHPEFEAGARVACAVGRRAPDGWHVTLQGHNRRADRLTLVGQWGKWRCAASVE
jgi:hypothetical protein